MEKITFMFQSTNQFSHMVCLKRKKIEAKQGLVNLLIKQYPTIEEHIKLIFNRYFFK